MFCAKELRGVGLSDLMLRISWGCLPSHQDPDSSSLLFLTYCCEGRKSQKSAVGFTWRWGLFFLGGENARLEDS